MITTGTNVKILKGCNARNVAKGTTWHVREVQVMGAEHSHQARVVLTRGPRVLTFWARHINRLSDPTVRMNDGSPSYTIEVKALAPGELGPGMVRSR